jgi:hypothetical protein
MYVKRIFNELEKECILVQICDKEYDACEVASCNFWGNSKKGAYGVGLGRTDDDPYKPARTGLLGQMAFSKVIGESVDLEYREGGDKQDNLIGKYKFDMKCAMRNYGCALIYHTNEWGKKIPLDKDVYVLGYMESEDREKKIANVIIVGYALKEDVSKCLVKPGRKGRGHLNYEVPFGSLKPITHLIAIKKKHFGGN